MLAVLPPRATHTAPGHVKDFTHVTALVAGGASGDGPRYMAMSPTCLIVQLSSSLSRVLRISRTGSASCSSFAAAASSGNSSSSGSSLCVVRPLRRRWGCVCVHMPFPSSAAAGGQANSGFSSMGASSSSLTRRPLMQSSVSALIRAIWARRRSSSLPWKAGCDTTFAWGSPVMSRLIIRAEMTAPGLTSGRRRQASQRSFVA
mmetsp:Transcript_39283/g.111045  ORF Transcript_39283/g.111045 Transcript_39283/m.111045 type:complete len:203 (-) Transcript_39283:552-1160(-)